ncbi:MAG: 3-dehydroquinate synthase [Candidatus Omnitrophica bacterium]|nr:3-dehydroquinate synthase [Candidatus Omnitrophota bacterium]
MRVLKLNLKKRSYDIFIGKGLLKSSGKYLRRLNIGSDAYVITNSRIKKNYGAALTGALKRSGFTVRFKLVPDTEKSKSLQAAADVIKDIALYDKKRKIFIIAFGGGVVGDLAGFIASIYKRGVPYAHIPTTLLAQVDSGIGGKTAVDLSQGKNLLGAFYQPRLVISDVSALKSLDARQVKNGLSEIIKYAVIKDAALFNYLEKNHKNILALKDRALEFAVARCSAIKARIVGMDEREEKGIRTILNFGHTIGHAIEAAGGFAAYNHGEAVALGMLAASEISVALGLTSEAALKRIEKLIKAVGLPVKIKGISSDKIIQAHYRDKKFSGAENRFVLIEGIGKTRIVRNVPLEAVRRALKKRM